MAKPQNQKPPFALRALAAFAVTLAALFVLLLAAYALPGEPVRDHVYDSAVKIAGEGLYPEYLNFKLFKMDNYTDTIMLTEAASADEAPPLMRGPQVLANVMRYARNGSIITFHDSLKSWNNGNLQYALPRALDFLEEEGYEFKLL